MHLPLVATAPDDGVLLSLAAVAPAIDLLRNPNWILVRNLLASKEQLSAALMGFAEESFAPYRLRLARADACAAADDALLVVLTRAAPARRAHRPRREVCRGKALPMGSTTQLETNSIGCPTASTGGVTGRIDEAHVGAAGCSSDVSTVALTLGVTATGVGTTCMRTEACSTAGVVDGAAAMTTRSARREVACCTLLLFAEIACRPTARKRAAHPAVRHAELRSAGAGFEVAIAGTLRVAPNPPRELLTAVDAGEATNAWWLHVRVNAHATITKKP